MPNLDKIPRKLEERSHLTFEFPQTNKRVFRAYLPFLENPKVSERGSSNLNEYNLIGRSGTLFSYGGANSREITIVFKISLLNLLHLDTEEGLSDKFKRSFNLFFSDRERAMERFKLISYESSPGPLVTGNPSLSPLPPGAYTVLSTEASDDLVNELKALNTASQLQELTTAGDIQVGVGFPHADTHRSFYRELVGQVVGSDPVFDDISNILIDSINQLPTKDAPSISSSKESIKRMNNLIDMVYVWVNLVRASVLNNSQNTVQGPPTIRLTHGPMYNNIPCVAEDYSIRIMDESGFEAQTLTPKQLEITLKLRENRTGDFNSFKQGKVEGGDTIAGWEAIIKDNNLDPYNGLINKDRENL